MQHFTPPVLPGNPLHLPASGRVTTPQPLASSLYSLKADILAMEDEWHGLEAVSPDTVLFQSFNWCRNHLEFNGDSADFRPMVYVVRKGGEPLLLLPLCLQHKNGMDVLTGFSEPFQQYTEILCDREAVERAGREPVRDCLLAALTQSGADYLHFGQVREDGALAWLLEGRATPSGEADAAPYVALSEHATHADYLKTIRSKTRKNLRNARNRLERDAPVSHRVARSGSLLSEVITRTYDGREAWLEAMGITSRAFQNVDFEAFLHRFGALEEKTGVEVIAMSLRHGETCISDQWGFIYQGRYYAFMATWNPDYEAVSPGRLHLGEVIHTCIEEGFAVADFMIPAADYKLTWTDRMTPVRDYVLPLNLKGKAYTRLWLDFARPQAKRLFFALPAGLRGRILKLVTGK